MPTITSKGQVTIPKRIRDALGLKGGSKVDLLLEGDTAVLRRVQASRVASAAGVFRKYAGKAGRLAERELMENVRREVADAAAAEGRSSRHKRAS
jgi:AbrB family looped-hinge helix DNA binding protein